ncbi:MAG: adenylate/guanylate cyclase domain-containing protein, partial [Omnitrophica WOR_2 bacterium]
SGNVAEKQMRNFFRILPANPRCKNCYAPFKGIGGAFVRLLLNKRRSPHNALICNVCENFAIKYPGGTEINLTMLFADVRGSTALAEKMSSMDFSRLIDRFFNTSIDVFTHHDAVIDRLVGDEMIGYFLPSLAGSNHPQRAFEAALDLLSVTGHGSPEGPWTPIGIGVHTGMAFFGSVGRKDGVMDITALGDAVNTTARLASQAGAGEVLISEAAYQAAGLELGNLEKRSLSLKGRSEEVPVRVFRVGNEVVAAR